MEISYRRADFTNNSELRIIGEVDARIPLAYDTGHVFAEASISARLDFYQQLAEDDFFDVATAGNDLIGFHIIRKTPYPPELFIGSIISLWVHPDYRGKGIAGNLKARGEYWARAKSLEFLQTQVHVQNQRMIEVNREHGYEVAYLNLRKQL